MDRAHRIGQKKEVNVFRFCVENSIEEKVIEKAYKKLRLDALVIQQGRLTENTKSVNKDDLLAMVRYGAEMVFSSEASAPPAQLQAPLPQCTHAHSGAAAGDSFGWCRDALTAHLMQGECASLEPRQGGLQCLFLESRLCCLKSHHRAAVRLKCCHPATTAW